MDQWDAVKFVPKRDVVFFGFGIGANYYSKDNQLIFQWNLGDRGEDYESEEYTVEFLAAEKEEGKFWHSFDIRSVGAKPLKVAEGQAIHVKVKATKEDDFRKLHYGYSGEKDTYSTLPDQEYDFDMQDSNFNSGSTYYYYGQFPFILYN